MTQKDIDERGNHTLVFFSLILALSIANLVEAWTKLFSLGFQLTNLLHPEGFLLFSISLLSFQYWWVIYRQRSYYGKTLWHFVEGVGENVVLYALTLVLREIYLHGVTATDEQRFTCFLLFIVLVGLFILYGCLSGELKSWRQLFRIVAFVLAAIGLAAGDEMTRNITAGLIAALMSAFTIHHTLTPD